MIRLGGLTWSLAVAAEFWHTAYDSIVAHPAELSRRDIETQAVDRIGGAIERPTAGNVARCRWQAANDADANDGG